MKIHRLKSGRMRSYTKIINPDVWTGTVLDIGSSFKLLKNLVEIKDYTSLDCDPEAHPDISLDVLDYNTDKTYRSVVAFNVLEHTDNIYATLDKMFNLSETYLVLALPNCYYIKNRLRFLRHKPIAWRHRLHRHKRYPLGYRHRWIYTFNELSNLINDTAKKNGFELIETDGIVSNKVIKYPRVIATWIAPRLFVKFFLFTLRRPNV